MSVKSDDRHALFPNTIFFFEEFFESARVGRQVDRHVDTFFFVYRIVLSQNAEKRAQFEPPLGFREAEAGEP